MEVQSTNLTVFVYSNGFMEELLGDLPCKDGVVYKKFGAIELMPMGYPNAVNQVGSFDSIGPGFEHHWCRVVSFSMTCKLPIVL